MTEREALKLALEALELHLTHHEHGCVYLDPAVAAIKEALAQPEQEPVAWAQFSEAGNLIDLLEEPCGGYVPLYTTPPQRTWVGLTGEQKLSLEIQGGKADVMLAELVEQWLKEKNT